jgi:hypothetical protein
MPGSFVAFVENNIYCLDWFRLPKGSSKCKVFIVGQLQITEGDRVKIKVIAIILSLIAVSAFATIQWGDLFVKVYHPKSGTPLAKAGCVVCHNKAGSVALNPYGSSLKGKSVTLKSLRNVEKLDSDKDGVKNITEIKSGTLPGNPKSKP